MLMFAQSVLTGQCVRCTLYTLHTVYILSMQVVSIHLKEPTVLLLLEMVVSSLVMKWSNEHELLQELHSFALLTVGTAHVHT